MYTKTHALFFSFPDIDRCQVNFEPIGCYKAVSQPLDDYRLSMWKKAVEKGYVNFGLQFYGKLIVLVLIDILYVIACLCRTKL